MAWHSTVSLSAILKRLKTTRYIFYLFKSPVFLGQPIYHWCLYAGGIWVKILTCQTSTDSYRQMRETFWSVETKHVDNDYRQLANVHDYQRFNFCVMKVVVMQCPGLSCNCKAFSGLGLTWCHVFLELNIYCSLSNNKGFIKKNTDKSKCESWQIPQEEWLFWIWHSMPLRDST